MSPWTPLAVEALPVMRPRGGEGREGETAAAESPAEFAERVREQMSIALDAPRVDLGVEDWARLKSAGVAVDPSGTKVLWRPEGGPGSERVEVVAGEDGKNKEA